MERPPVNEPAGPEEGPSSNPPPEVPPQPETSTAPEEVPGVSSPEEIAAARGKLRSNANTTQNVASEKQGAPAKKTEKSKSHGGGEERKLPFWVKGIMLLFALPLAGIVAGTQRIMAFAEGKGGGGGGAKKKPSGGGGGHH